MRRYDPVCGRFARAMASAEKRLEELGIELAAPLTAVANYRMTRRHGDLVFVSGHVPVKPDGSGPVTGKVGRDLTTEEAADAARLTTLHILSSIRAELGSLDEVAAVLRVLGMVNAAEGYTDMPKVVNGCSDLLVDVFGEDVGKHARAAVGVAELPLDAAVEIEMVVAVRG
jgi:enamine deaminase RidA (YjgF/YER057c/UK114 family)